VPRSAFLEGARKAGGTKTCTGAIAKQKTAAPQGAASLSFAVLESEGGKGKRRLTERLGGKREASENYEERGYGLSERRRW
jgi:hypothetical protein